MVASTVWKTFGLYIQKWLGMEFSFNLVKQKLHIKYGFDKKWPSFTNIDF